MHVYGNDGRASIIVQTHSTMESQLPPWTIISYVRFITPIAFSTPGDLLLVFFFIDGFSRLHFYSTWKREIGYAKVFRLRRKWTS